MSALTSNQVQAADIYSTTPSITANKLVTLTDPKNVFAAQQVLPVVSADKATTASAASSTRSRRSSPPPSCWR